MCKNNVTSTRSADSADAAINGDYVTTLIVPTKGAAPTDGAPKRVIDTRNLSEDDLKALKKQDPFLYYSIPRPVRRSSSTADVTTQHNQESARSCSRRASCPSRVESSPSPLVERKSCISFECHTDIELDDFMDDTEVCGNVDGVDLDTETLFDELFLRQLRYKRQQ